MVNYRKWVGPAQIFQGGMSEQTSPVATLSMKIANTD